MSAQDFGNLLAPVNAVFNLMSTICLLLGFYFIKRRDVRRHRFAMVGAVAASALFLVFYVTRFTLTGTHEFAGTGGAKIVYLTILFSHMILATAVVPLVLRLIWLVRKRRFHAHAQLAKITYPIWLYVSVTGITVYVMLYHMYGYK